MSKFTEKHNKQQIKIITVTQARSDYMNLSKVLDDYRFSDHLESLKRRNIFVENVTI